MFLKVFVVFWSGGFKTDFNSFCANSFNLFSEYPEYSGFTKNNAFSK